MAEPSKKSEAMEAQIKALFGFDRREVIRANRCAPKSVGGCEAQLTGTSADFRDDLSAREYSITGYCQACQDRIFKTSPQSKGVDVTEFLSDEEGDQT